MKISTVIQLASAALIVAAMAAGPGCSKKGQQTGAPAGASLEQSSGQATGQATGEASQSAPSAGEPAPSGQTSATEGAAQGAPSAATRTHVGNTPAGAVAGATGQAEIVKPLLPPGGVAPEIAAVNAVAPTPVTPVAEIAKPAAPEPECFHASFRHDKSVSHSSDEICSQHQNLLVLKHANINVASLCVRVNGRPVRFDRVKGHPEQLVIGAVAGPKAEITANYCVGKATCQEECKVPKDEFLDAIGGTEEVGQHLGKWLETDQDSGGAIAAQMDAQLKKELAELEDKGELYKGWSGGSEPRECKRGMASAPAVPKGKKAAMKR